MLEYDTSFIISKLKPLTTRKPYLFSSEITSLETSLGDSALRVFENHCSRSRAQLAELKSEHSYFLRISALVTVQLYLSVLFTLMALFFIIALESQSKYNMGDILSPLVVAANLGAIQYSLAKQIVEFNNMITDFESTLHVTTMLHAKLMEWAPHNEWLKATFVTIAYEVFVRLLRPVM